MAERCWTIRCQREQKKSLNIAPVETIHLYIESQGEKDKPGSKNKDLSKFL